MIPHLEIYHPHFTPFQGILFFAFGADTKKCIIYWFLDRHLPPIFY